MTATAFPLPNTPSSPRRANKAHQGHQTEQEIMTKKIANTQATAVETAVATVAELEAAHRAAQQDSAQAQAHAAGLPGRLAAGDDTVTTDDLVQAGPAAAVAQAKATATGRELAAARAGLEQARADELAARLHAGELFVHQDEVDAELDKIAAYVQRELRKLGNRLETHNQALRTVVASLPKDGGYVFTSDGGGLTVSRHRIHGNTVELDGRQWWALPTDGWGQDILERIELAEAQARDVVSEPAPRNLTQWEMLAQEQAAAPA